MRIQITRMFIIMAVKTQQFPVAAVFRIIIMIVIAMMHRQLMQVLMVEFTTAPATNPGIQFERLFPVGTRTFLILAPRTSDDLVKFILI